MVVWSGLLDGRSHPLKFVRHQFAVTLRFGSAQFAFGCGDLVVELCQCSAQCLSAVLGGAHVGFSPIELRIGGSSHRETCGCSTYFSKRRLGGAETVGQLLPRHVLVFERAFEAFDRTGFTFAE